MDGVPVDGRRVDGFESAEANVERDIGRGNAGGGETGEELVREMEAGGGGGDSDLAVTRGIDGLVAFAVGGADAGGGVRGVAVDVRGQGHFTEAVCDVGDGFGAGGIEADKRGAAGVFFEDTPGEIGAMREGGAGREFFSGTQKAPPSVVAARGVGAEQEALDGSACGALRAEAGGEDGGVVAEKCVGGAEELWKGGKSGVREGVGSAVNNEQARGIAPRRGRLRDEAWRKLVVEKAGGKRHGGWRNESQDVEEIEEVKDVEEVKEPEGLYALSPLPPFSLYLLAAFNLLTDFGFCACALCRGCFSCGFNFTPS